MYYYLLSQKWWRRLLFPDQNKALGGVISANCKQRETKGSAKCAEAERGRVPGNDRRIRSQPQEIPAAVMEIFEFKKGCVIRAVPIPIFQPIPIPKKFTSCRHRYFTLLILSIPILYYYLNLIYKNLNEQIKTIYPLFICVFSIDFSNNMLPAVEMHLIYFIYSAFLCTSTLYYFHYWKYEIAMY